VAKANNINGRFEIGGRTFVRSGTLLADQIPRTICGRFERGNNIILTGGLQRTDDGVCFQRRNDFHDENISRCPCLARLVFKTQYGNRRNSRRASRLRERRVIIIPTDVFASLAKFSYETKREPRESRAVFVIFRVNVFRKSTAAVGALFDCARGFIFTFTTVPCVSNNNTRGH